ncbi:MAG: hypothetical protein AAF310_06025 [Myxococcota bacterium]
MALYAMVAVWLSSASMPAYGQIHHPGKRAMASFLLPQLQVRYRYHPSQSSPKKWVVVSSDPSRLINNSDALPLEAATPAQNRAYESTQQLQQGQLHAVRVGVLWRLDQLLAGKRHSVATRLHQTRLKQHIAQQQSSYQAVQQLHKHCSSTTVKQLLDCWAQRMQAQAMLQALRQHHNGRRQP